jgi:hypothetical protein
MPNAEPSDPVDYVFIDQEPSLTEWALDEDDAREKVKAGYRNYVAGILRPRLGGYGPHFAIEHYLCEQGQEYFLTDISKGAMLVKEAEVERAKRWDKWYPLLLEEVRLVAKPGGGIFAFGNKVAEYLTLRHFPRPFTTVLHYSGVARSHRDACIKGREESFRQFETSITPELMLATAERVLQAIPAVFRDEVLDRMAVKPLSESDLKLIFCYKLAFERYKMTHPPRT